jgi:hypothetical protein
MRRLLAALGYVFGFYLLARAVAECFVIDFNDPSSYAGDWGGPHLAGVLAVHCGPGLVFLAALLGLIARRRRQAPPQGHR